MAKITREARELLEAAIGETPLRFIVLCPDDEKAQSINEAAARLGLRQVHALRLVPGSVLEGPRSAWVSLLESYPDEAECTIYPDEAMKMWDGTPGPMTE